MNIKICGVKTLEIAEEVISAGASHIGFVLFPKSPRNISPRAAGEIVNKIKDRIQTVIVTVNPTDELISETLLYFKPDYIQLHGHEMPTRAKEIMEKFDLKIIKAIAIKNKPDLQEAERYKKFVDYILFDSKPPLNSNLPGGNALSFDWKILENFAPDYKWILSGGLEQANVREAIQITKANFIDVSSGVESEPGVKDVRYIKTFINNANKSFSLKS
jgi:phosphoribosylanthranilate isomerase